MIAENGTVTVEVRGNIVAITWEADPDMASAMLDIPGIGEVSVRTARRYARAITQACRDAEDEHQFMGT